MRWLLVFISFPIWAFSQTLKPGLFRDLKPDKPIILDTGSYTFIGLDMKNLGKGVWLDGRKASKIELINSRFEGNGSGTGVLTNGNAQIIKSTFTNMDTGIQVLANEGTIRTLSISGNTFTDLATSISLNRIGEGDPATLNFTLKCNEFINNPQTTTSFTRKGLVIGEGVKVRAPNNLTGTNTLADQIGGAAGFNANGTAYPNANVWPTATDRDVIPAGGIQNLNTPDGWGLSPNWVSIENHFNNDEVIYHHFVNEFVGYGASLVGPVAFPPLPQAQWIVTGNQDEDATHVKACANFTDPVVLFPVLRIAVLDSSGITSHIKTIFDSPYLLDAIPNPAQQETKIGLYLPQKTEQAVLQILEFATGKVLQNIPIQERGKLETVLDVSKAPAGTYGYRLVVNGKSAAVKKIVVLH